VSIPYGGGQSTPVSLRRNVTLSYSMAKIERIREYLEEAKHGEYNGV
jgi:hypothetical protein